MIAEQTHFLSMLLFDGELYNITSENTVKSISSFTSCWHNADIYCTALKVKFTDNIGSNKVQECVRNLNTEPC